MEKVVQKNNVIADVDGVIEPYPLRFWWLKRISIFSGIFILFLIIIRVWWGYEADRRLQVEIDKLRQAGEKVFAYEFDAELDAVEDSENAAVLLEKAIKQIVSETSSGIHFESFLDDPESIETNKSAISELMQKNAKVFELIRQAKARPKVAWSERLKNTFTSTLSIYSGQRNLAKLLYVAATYHYNIGNHEKFVEVLDDFFFLNESIKEHPTIISGLVALACHDLNFNLIEMYSSKLIINGTSHINSLEITPAKREQITNYIRMLLDDLHCRKTVKRAFQGERAEALIMIYPFTNIGTTNITSEYPSPIQFIISPVFKLDIITTFKFVSIAIEAVAKTNWSKENLYSTNHSDSHNILQLISRPLSNTYYGTVANVYQTYIHFYYKFLVRKRMAAVALAIRLYEIDHGSRPNQLAQLVPDYLTSIPLDPFSETNQSLMYKPHAKYPVLYSIGKNGVDDGGMVLFDKKKQLKRNKLDILFYLDGKPKSEKNNSSGQTGKNNQDINNKNRQNNEDQSSKK